MVKKEDGGLKVSFEFSEWTVQQASSHDLRVAFKNRLQSDSDDRRIPMTIFFTEFSDYLETVVLCKEQLVLVADFNIHVDIPYDSYCTKFLDLLESFSLQQHVVGPTHIYGHTLELVIIRQSDQIVRSTLQVDRYFSDHASVLCQLYFITRSLSTRTLPFRKLKSTDVDSLNDDLAKIHQMMLTTLLFPIVKP